MMKKFEIVNNHNRLRIEISENGDFYMGIQQGFTVSYIKLAPEQVHQLIEYLQSVGR